MDINIVVIMLVVVLLKNDYPYLSCNRSTNECTVRDNEKDKPTKLGKCSKDWQNQYGFLIEKPTTNKRNKKAKSWDWDPYGNNGCSGGTVSAGAAGIFQFDFRGPKNTKTSDGQLIVDSSEQMSVVGDLTNNGGGLWTSFSDWASGTTDINVNGSGEYIKSYGCELTQSQVSN